MSSNTLAQRDVSRTAYDHGSEELLTVKILREVKTGLRCDLPLHALIAGFWVIGYFYLNLVGQIENSYFLIYFKLLFPLLSGAFMPLVVVYSAVKILLLAKKRRALAFRFMLAPRNAGRMISGFVLLGSICLLMGMFTAIKTSFGFTYGFVHDVWQADLDAILFLGFEPWQLLFTPFQSVWLQAIIEANYNVIWHLITFGTMFFFAISRPGSAFRMRYLACFILSWILIGNLFASLFISAGPAFYGLVTGDEARFGPQLEGLALYKDSTAVMLQEFLWSSYTSGHSGFGTGISAFPSMHVAATALNMIFAFEVSRRLGIIATIYAIFVLYSSVYLAWHYAIDGLFSALVVYGLYWLTKKAFASKPPVTAPKLTAS